MLFIYIPAIKADWNHTQSQIIIKKVMQRYSELVTLQRTQDAQYVRSRLCVFVSVGHWQIALGCVSDKHFGIPAQMGIAQTLRDKQTNTTKKHFSNIYELSGAVLTQNTPTKHKQTEPTPKRRNVSSDRTRRYYTLNVRHLTRPASEPLYIFQVYITNCSRQQRRQAADRARCDIAGCHWRGVGDDGRDARARICTQICLHKVGILLWCAHTSNAYNTFGEPCDKRGIFVAIGQCAAKRIFPSFMLVIAVAVAISRRARRPEGIRASER